MTEIRVFEHRTLLRHPREVVFRWLENPGALERLTPVSYTHLTLPTTPYV